MASVFIWGTAFASAPVFDWSVTYNVFRSDVGVAVAVDNENNIILVDSADDGQDFLLVKFDGQDGGEIWSHAYSFGGNSLNSLTDVDSNDNIIWGGFYRTDPPPPFSFDLHIWQLDSDLSTVIFI